MGRGRAAGWGRKKEVGRGWAKNRSWAQFNNKTFFEFLFGIQIFGNFGNLYKEI
jgi:hypothetical protein